MPTAPSTAAPSSPLSASGPGLAPPPWERWLADMFANGAGDLGAVAQGLQAQGCDEPLAGLLAAAGWLRHHRPSDGELTRSSAGRQALAMLRAAARADSVATSMPSQDDPQDNAAPEGLAGARLRLTALAPKVWLLDDVLKEGDCAALAADAGREARRRVRPALLQSLTALAERFYGGALQAPQFDSASSESTAVVLLAWGGDDAAWLHLPSQALACRVQQGSGLLIQRQGRQGQADPLGEVLFRQVRQQLASCRVASIALHWAVQA